VPEQIIINFSVDNSQLVSTIELLKKQGTITDDDAAKFVKLGQQAKRAYGDQVGLIENLNNRLQALRVARDQANDPAKIARINTILKEQGARYDELTGKATKAASISVVDVEKLRKDMADVVAQAEKDDPKALRRKIFELERELKKGGEIVVKENRVEVSVLKDSQITRLEKVFASMEKEAERHGNAMGLLWSNFNEIGGILKEALLAIRNQKQAKIFKPFSPPLDKKTVIFPKENNDFLGGNENKLRSGAMKMLSWLAGANTLSKQRLATLSGFAVTGGTFNTYISELKRNGWIVGNGDLSITDEGMKNTLPSSLPSGEDLLQLWKSKFREGAARILQVVYDQYPDSITKENIGAIVGFEPTGGTFNTYISELRRNGLIQIQGDSVKISDEFFE